MTALVGAGYTKTFQIVSSSVFDLTSLHENDFEYYDVRWFERQKNQSATSISNVSELIQFQTVSRIVQIAYSF